MLCSHVFLNRYNVYLISTIAYQMLASFFRGQSVVTVLRLNQDFELGYHIPERALLFRRLSCFLVWLTGTFSRLVIVLTHECVLETWC